mmetsp:Transcript_97775/g.276733  ORF Transcript_97775/g.276733 Transcript_97775/m.276733 type:complete len:207 (-) Transcript_97775:3-623(-)
MTGVSQTGCPTAADDPFGLWPPRRPCLFNAQVGNTSRRRSTLQVPTSRRVAKLTWNIPRLTSLFDLSQICTPGPSTSEPLARKVSVSPKRQGDGAPHAASCPSTPVLPSFLKSANSVSFRAFPNTTSKRGLSLVRRPGSARLGIEAESTRTKSRNSSTPVRVNCGSEMSLNFFAARTPPPKAVTACSIPGLRGVPDDGAETACVQE